MKRSRQHFWIATLQLHSSISSWSSNDISLYLAFKHKPKAGSIEKDFLLDSKLVHEEPTERDFVTTDYFKDKTFYKSTAGSKHDHHDTPEYKELAKRYLAKGWLPKLPPDAALAQKKQFRIDNMRSIVKRRKENHVLIGNKHVPDDYKGNLPEAVWEDEELQDYIKSGIAFGYIGASERTFDSDDAVMHNLLQIQKLDPMVVAAYIKSSNGRHFADNLGPLCEYPNRKAFYEEIDKGLEGVTSIPHIQEVIAKTKVLREKQAARIPKIETEEQSANLEIDLA